MAQWQAQQLLFRDGTCAVLLFCTYFKGGRTTVGSCGSICAATATGEWLRWGSMSAPVILPASSAGSSCAGLAHKPLELAASPLEL
jgi:hypothetical protein